MDEPPQKRVKSEASPVSSLPPLPAGWTEHTAPTGHRYYYNKATKKSTYTRPAAEPALPAAQELAQPAQPYSPYAAESNSWQAPNSFQEAQQSWNGQAQPIHHGQAPYEPPQRPSGDTRQQSTQSSHRPRLQLADRPKRKEVIPNCGPWVLVYTKLGRRFVHNPRTRESYWKFPEDVMKAVIALDQLHLEKKHGKGPVQNGEEQKVAPIAPEVGIDEQEIEKHRSAVTQSFQREQEEDAALLRGNEEERIWVPPAQPADKGYDSSEYEEIEVTDDSDLDSNADQEESDPEPAQPGPIEFNEDDIAHQLAAMEAEQAGYSDEEEDYPPSADEDPEADLLEREAVFVEMLADHDISPFTPWDALLDPSSPLLADKRFTVIPSAKARAAAHAAWAKAAIAEKRAEQKPVTASPREVFLAFLATNRSPALYWPEFKRKHKRDPALKGGARFGEREMEKAYREFAARSKDSAAVREGALKKALGDKGDVRLTVAYWVVPAGRREEIAHT